MHTKSFRTTRFYIMILACIYLPAFPASAESPWIDYHSETGVYSVKIPRDHTVEYTPFRIGDDAVIHSGSLTARVDQRPYKNSIKSYIVKFSQTIGPPFDRETALSLVKSELDAYEQHFKAMGGVVKDRKTLNYSYRTGGEIYITYNDDLFGEQSIRARVFYSDVSKINQTVIGRDYIMYDRKSNAFMDSLQLGKGVTLDRGSLKESWKTYTSPTGSFTVALPPVQPPYVLAEPTIRFSENTELLSTSFHDPVRGHDIFYNVYTYHFDRNVTFSDATSVIMQNHVIKHRKTYLGVNLEKGYTADNLPTIKTTYAVKPPPEYPYLNTVQLRAFFRNNQIMVQEAMSSRSLISSVFLQNVMALYEFHPEETDLSLAGAGSGPTEQQTQDTPPE